MSIEKLNKKIKRCTRCVLSETRRNALPGEGNIRARLFLVAQAPGEKEDREGRMFIGPSGKMLDELLEIAGINRKEIYMTNLIKCMLPKYRKPKQDEIESCSIYLEKEVDLIHPKFLVTLGYYATHYVFKKTGFSLPPRSQFSEDCGKLFWNGEKKILPLPHPALALYNPSFKKDMLQNYHKLKVISTDCKWYVGCPLKRFYELEKLDKKWIELYCKGDWERCIRYQMEGQGESHPDWMLPNGEINEQLHRLCNTV